MRPRMCTSIDAEITLVDLSHGVISHHSYGHAINLAVKCQ